MGKAYLNPNRFEMYKKETDYTNNYFGSKYNHWDFHEILESGAKVSWLHIHKPVVMADLPLSFQKRYKPTADYNLLFYRLVEYYSDLNKVLERFVRGEYDCMFHIFAKEMHLFLLEDVFSWVCNAWDETFFIALENYIKEVHSSFVDGQGSYVGMFNRSFHHNLCRSMKELNYARSNPTGFRAHEYTEETCPYGNHYLYGIESYRFKGNTENPILATSPESLDLQIQSRINLEEQLFCQGFSRGPLSILETNE